MAPYFMWHPTTTITNSFNIYLRDSMNRLKNNLKSSPMRGKKDGSIAKIMKAFVVSTMQSLEETLLLPFSWKNMGQIYTP